MLRILHLADVHLDRPFVRTDRRQSYRDRARLRETFVRCLEPAHAGNVDAVTIGGDLWEDEHVSADTRRFVAAELAKAACPVLLVCGNHDPLLSGGNYERTAWPDNVWVFDAAELSEQRVADEVSVWGLSWGGGSLEANFLDSSAVPRDGRTHLLLVHGTATPLATVYDDPSYCPFEPRRITEAGFAYCLAGHIHGARQTAEVVYPGSPEPLGWAEMGRHCSALVAIRRRQTRGRVARRQPAPAVERAVDCRAPSTAARSPSAFVRLSQILSPAACTSAYCSRVRSPWIAKSPPRSWPSNVARHMPSWLPLIKPGRHTTSPHWLNSQLRAGISFASCVSSWPQRVVRRRPTNSVSL